MTAREDAFWARLRSVRSSGGAILGAFRRCGCGYCRRGLGRGLETRYFAREGVESLIEHRASIEEADRSAPPDLLRLSVGIENPATCSPTSTSS